jgi:hypothetical protein
MEPLKGGVGVGQTAPGLVNERRNVLPLERVGGAFRVVLVVSGAGSHDPVEVTGERPQRSLGARALGGQPGTRT